MSLRTLHLPITLDTSTDDMVADLYAPALAASVSYDRGVGFFSSGWLRIVAQGMVPFAAHGGRARIITSPILDSDDWNALQTGVQAQVDPLLRRAIVRNLSELESTLAKETLSALAWMVADGVLTFKLALPQHKLAGGDFHDKFGIFTDAAGDQVSFNGSPNESIRGTVNYESNKVFKSWEPAFAPLVAADVRRFDRLWTNQDLNVRVYDLPEAALENIVRLRTQDRPYPAPPWLPSHISEIPYAYKPSHPSLPPQLALHPYQDEAIDAWFVHECRGLLEMATGTGKTITALAASVRLFEREGRLAVVIAVPYQHLVDQWQTEAVTFGYRPILAYQNKSSWLDELNHGVIEFNGGYRPFISVITTHTTFINPDFQSAIARLAGPGLLIADEVHHLGAERSRQNYPDQIPFRLALSATPDRWFDDDGTAALRAFFGETVFAFSLEQAIGVSLTPYYYYPHLVSLTDDEMDEYEKLSIRIARLLGQGKPGSQGSEKPDALKLLLIKRALLLNTAANKLPALAALLDAEKAMEHTLFYCAPGQIDDVMQLVGWEKGILVNQFTAEESTGDRQQLLADFASGTLQALAAMKCLDEGVDVPSTRTAYFLASSGNPREFIQRRGRILRKAPGKEYSIIHDLIAIPPNDLDRESTTFQAERSIVRRELQRFTEFANPALNKHQALDVIWEIAEHYGLLDLSGGASSLG